MECKKCGSRWESALMQESCPFCGAYIAEVFVDEEYEECFQCGSKWISAGHLASCPFCKAALPKDPSTFDDITSVLRFIIRKHGRKIFDEPKKALSIISDLAPDLQSERKLLNVCFSSAAFRTLANADASDDSELQISINKVRMALRDDLFLDSSLAEKAIGWVLDSLGLSTTENDISFMNAERILKKGDIIKLGDYYGKMNWIILDVESDMALVLCEKGIDCKKFNDRHGYVKWSESSLKYWLNDTFFNKYFTTEEKKRIQKKDTHSKVFLLSLDEAEGFLPDNADRICLATARAEANGAYRDSHYKGCRWWLRTSGKRGKDDSRACSVDCDGMIFEIGANITDNGMCVRPAMWIKLKF